MSEPTNSTMNAISNSSDSRPGQATKSFEMHTNIALAESPKIGEHKPGLFICSLLVKPGASVIEDPK
jgi:hypothetical protein